MRPLVEAVVAFRKNDNFLSLDFIQGTQGLPTRSSNSASGLGRDRLSGSARRLYRFHRDRLAVGEFAVVEPLEADYFLRLAVFD
jgi:hypothetical protein